MATAPEALGRYALSCDGSLVLPLLRGPCRASSIGPLKMDEDFRAQLVRYFLTWLGPDAERTNPTYAVLTKLIARSDDLLELAAEVPPPQLSANVLFASIHDLLLSGVEHPLANRYQSVVRLRGLTPAVFAADDLERDFVAFASQFREQIAALCRTGITQTNELARTAMIAAALGDLREEGILDVGIVDAGCSAGLNCFPELYRINHGDDTFSGPPTSSVVLNPKYLGRRPATGLPKLSVRVGLDQHPLDPANPLDARWLEACLWPDDLLRFDRLAAGLALAAANRSSLQLIEGDLVDDLEQAIAQVPADLHVFLVNGWSTAYLPPHRRPAFAEVVDHIGHSRDLTWLSMEGRGVARDLGVVASGWEPNEKGSTVLTVRRYRSQTATTTILGESHPHGAWLNLS